jgi:hypothetical protein
MKTISLTTAVLLTLKSFASDTFSIFNITRAIREDVNDGEYEISGSGRTVSHDEVKSIFIELLDDVIGDQYDVSDSGRGYREFRKTQALTPIANLPVAIQTPSLPATLPNPTPIKLSTEAQGIIGKYLGNNGPATMKQIQSRLKGHPYTCKDLAEYLDSIGLINRTTKTDAHSKIWTL